MSKVHFERSDVEALIARMNSITPEQWLSLHGEDAGNHCAGCLLEDAKDALELSLSPTPTGGDRERLAKVLFVSDVSNGWGDTAPEIIGKCEEVADAILAVCMPVTPEPVYEYSLKAGVSRTIESEPTDEQIANVVRKGWSFERRVKAGPWLPVEGEKK